MTNAKNARDQQEKEVELGLKTAVFFGTWFCGILWMAWTIFAYGFVLSQLWDWFMVAKFGLPAISVLEGYGIMLVISMFTYKPDDYSKKHPWRYMWLTSIKPWVTLGFGWITYQLMQVM